MAGRIARCRRGWPKWVVTGGADAASSHCFATVSVLAVSPTFQGTGGVHYVAIQVDQNTGLNGPRVLFDESSFRSGSVVAGRIGKPPHGWR